MTPPLDSAERAAWLGRRRRCLGSSECWQIFMPWLASRGVAVVDLGAGPAHVAMPLVDSGPHKVWLAKHGEPEPEPEDPSDPRTVGQLHEPGVIGWAARALNTTAEPLKHVREGWMGATGDAMLGIGEGLEVKFVQYAHNKDIWYEDAAPLFVQLQALWCARRYGVPRWHIAAFVPGRNHVLYPPVDLTNATTRKWADTVEKVCGRWWQRHVEGGEPPPPDHTASCQVVIRKTYPTHTDEVRRATADEADLLRAYLDTGAAKRRAQTEHELAKSRLTAAIGGDLGIRARGLGTATWKADKSGNRRLNVKTARRAR